MAVFSSGECRKSLASVRVERMDFGELHFHPEDFIGLEVYQVVGKKKYGINLSLPNQDSYSVADSESLSEEEVFGKFYGHLKSLVERKASIVLDLPEEGLVKIFERKV